MIRLERRFLEALLKAAGRLKAGDDPHLCGIHVGPKYLTAANNQRRRGNGTARRYRHDGDFNGHAFLHRELIETALSTGSEEIVIESSGSSDEFGLGKILAGEEFPFYMDNNYRPLDIEFLSGGDSPLNYSPIPGWNMRLCYVKDNIIYFTDDMKNVRGDHWSHESYEDKSDPPYDEYVVAKIMYSSESWIMLPDEHSYTTGPYSVHQINEGVVPWLASPRDSDFVVHAGANLRTVCKFLQWHDIEIFYPMSLTHIVQQKAFNL